MNEIVETNEDADEVVVCKPTKWFMWRAVAMLAMFGVFMGLFLMDGMSGYQKKNLHYYMYQTFVGAGAAFQAWEQEGGGGDRAWRRYAEEQVCAFPEGSEGELPEGTDMKQGWPEELLAGYEVMKAEGGQNGALTLWTDYTGRLGQGNKPSDYAYGVEKIREQFWAAGVCGVLVCGVLFVLVRTMGREMKVDGEAFYSQDGRVVKFDDMVRVDKRKWDAKGMAFIDYKKEDGSEGRLKVDGMVYGQFDQAEGEPAERLFRQIMKHFKGEVLEYVEEVEEG